MEVHTLDIQPMQVVGIAHRGSYSTIGKSFEELHQWQERTTLEAAPLVAIYYDDPHQVPEEKLRSVAGVIVKPDFQSSGEGVEEVSIPGGKYAMASVVGDYSNLPKAWEDFYGAIFGSGIKTRADLCFERYLNTPGEVPPDQLITELYVPLAG